MQDLGSFQPEAINGRGDVAGWMPLGVATRGGGSDESLCLMSGGRLHHLRTFGLDYNGVSSLNDSDNLIVNHGKSAGQQAWIRQKGQLIFVHAKYCCDCQFTAINNNGLAVGRIDGAVVLWHEGKITPLPQLASEGYILPNGLNDHGQVVGTIPDRSPDPLPGRVSGNKNF